MNNADDIPRLSEAEQLDIQDHLAREAASAASRDYERKQLASYMAECLSNRLAATRREFPTCELHVSTPNTPPGFAFTGFASIDPYVLLILGKDSDGYLVQIAQHVTQMNLAVRMTQKEGNTHDSQQNT